MKKWKEASYKPDVRVETMIKKFVGKKNLTRVISKQKDGRKGLIVCGCTLGQNSEKSGARRGSTARREKSTIVRRGSTAD